MMEFINSPLADALGTTLLHSIWQGAAASVVIILGSYLLNENKSTLRYWLNISVLGLFTIINLSTLAGILSTSGSMNFAKKAVSVIDLSSVSQSINFIRPATSMLDSISPYFLMFWLCGMLLFSVRLWINYHKSNLLRRAPGIEVPEEVSDLLSRLKESLKIDRLVRITQSKKVSTPTIVGHLKPVILFPIGLLNGLSTDQVEAIILHELSHIKRNDYLVNILQSIVEVIYFFNPFVWLISASIRIERENASDDTALTNGVDRGLYVSTLAKVYTHSYHKQALSLALGYNNKTTLKRIQRIMKTQSNNNNKLFVSTAFIFVVSAAIYFNAQSQVPALAEPPLFPKEIALAAPIPSLDINIGLAKVQKVEPIHESVTKPLKPTTVKPNLAPVDTIDREEMKRKAQDLENAMEKLYSTKEYKEFEKLQKEMLEEQMEYMREITPAIEDAMRLAEKSLKLDEEELRYIDEKMEEITGRLSEMEISEEVERAMELSARAMEETMRKIEIEMSQIDIAKSEQIAQDYARNIRQIEAEMERLNLAKNGYFADGVEEMAKEAQEIAEQAHEIAQAAHQKVEKVENFLAQIKPMLVDDGYIKSEDELDNLKFEEGKVWVNEKEVNSKDAKRYYKIRSKYFDEDEDFFMN